MKIILGLGNPGIRFRFSRHNIGFLVVERLARAKKIKINQRTFNCLLGRGTIEKQKVVLGFPLTFMNLSADAVVPIVRRKKIKLGDLLIVCDDINLPLGKIRVRAKGSDGGHKGLRSIIEGLKSKDFSRLRIGTGKPKVKSEKDIHRLWAQKRGKLTRFVLGGFNKKESKVVNEAIEKAVSCCQVWAKEGIMSAMNRFNRG